MRHNPSTSSQITYISRKRSLNAYSIEKLFDALYARFATSGLRLDRLELPCVSTGIGPVLRNAWFVARRRRSTIVHITGDVHYAALLCPFARTIITVHDCVVLQRGTGLKRLVMRALWFDLPLRMATAVVVISEQTKQEVLRTVQIADNKITVIPNFVDPIFEFSARPFAAARPRILHVGTTPNKNTLRVIEALRGIPCELVIVGPLSAAMRTALELHSVRFENAVGLDDTGVAQLYRDSDIVSFPSTYEGFGMPILEGQAVGRPVLTSDLEPMRSVAGPDGAMWVDPMSVPSIRAGFLKLISEEVIRNRLIATGRKNVDRFKLEEVAATYMQLYRSVEERVST